MHHVHLRMGRTMCDCSCSGDDRFRESPSAAFPYPYIAVVAVARSARARCLLFAIVNKSPKPSKQTSMLYDLCAIPLHPVAPWTVAGRWTVCGWRFCILLAVVGAI